MFRAVKLEVPKIDFLLPLQLGSWHSSHNMLRSRQYAARLNRRKTGFVRLKSRRRCLAIRLHVLAVLVLACF